MRIACFVLILLVVSGCGKVSSDQSVDADSEVTLTDEVDKQQELTEEDKKYINLIEAENYDKVIEETLKIPKDDPLKNYYFIAAAFKQEKENRVESFKNTSTDEIMYRKAESAYSLVISNLNAMKFVPKELEVKVEELRTLAMTKMQHYGELANEQKTLELADERTDNPGEVTIGMTVEEVLTQGWGRPQEINKTTTASGVNEQWIYPNFNYLYFEDGILVTIQN